MSIRHVTLRQLQVFEAVARHLSFSRAAGELHLSQPGVSMQIREIEQSAGLPLFERVGKKVFVTEAGRHLLATARGVLGSLKDAEAALDALKGLRGGLISIAVVSTARYFAPYLLARFRKLHPEVELRLAVDNREAVAVLLTDNAVDLAIMGRAPKTHDAVAEAFASHPLVIVAAPDHPLAARRGIPVAAIASEAFLVREPGSGTRSAMQQFFDEHGVAPRVAMEMSSNETIKQAVMAGMGVSFISRHTVGFELQHRRLVLLDVRGLPVMREWNVVHLAAKRLSPSAYAFKSYVLAHGRDIVHAYAGVEGAETTI